MRGKGWGKRGRGGGGGGKGAITPPPNEFGGAVVTPKTFFILPPPFKIYPYAYGTPNLLGGGIYPPKIKNL